MAFDEDWKKIVKCASEKCVTLEYNARTKRTHFFKKRFRSKSVPNIRTKFVIQESRMKTVFQEISDRKLAPLLAAVKCGYIELLKFLLSEGADYNGRNTFGMNCLHLAAKEGHYDMVKYLVELPQFVNSKCMENMNVQPYGIYDGYTALHFAADNNQLEIAQLLLDNGAEVDVNDYISVSTPLLNALKQSNLEMVKLLLKYGANMKAMDKHGNSALHIATSNIELSDATDIVDIVLQAGININLQNKNGDTALHIACKNIKAFKCLSTKSCDVNILNKSKKTPLFVAVENSSHPDIIKELLELGASCDGKDADENTTLHIACMHMQVLNVETLLKHSDINVRNKDHLTPIMVAVKYNHMNIVQRLLKSPQANIHLKNKLGETALCMAIKDNRLGLAKLLIKNGADVHVRDANKSTLLHHAINKSIYCVQFVLKCGVDLDAVDIFNKTAMEVVVEKQNLNILQFLLDYRCSLSLSKKSFVYCQLRTRRRCRDMFYSHLIKMECLGYYIPPSKMALFQKLTMEEPRGFDTKQFRLICMKEVEKLKAMTFEGTCITLYSLLKKNPHQLARCMENSNVNMDNHLHFQFLLDIYGPMIRLAIERGLTQKSLLTRCKRHFNLLVQHLPVLPNFCVDLILYNLNNRDLQLLIDMFTPAELKYSYK